MHVLEVLPLTTLPPQIPQILSYYHDGFLPKGAIVEVPLNNRPITAAVIDGYDLEEQKILVKKSLFQLKKVTKVISAEPLIADWQFKIALWIASRYVAALGPAMNAVLPPFFLKPRYPLVQVGSFAAEPASPPPSWIITRAQHSARHILSILKSGNGGQTLIVVPDTSYIPYFTTELKQFSPESLTSATPNKDYYRIWNETGEGTIKMVIGTRQALFLPFSDLRRVIVIDPLHEFYKSDMTPKYWTPELAEMIARNYGARYIALSSSLGVEAYAKSQSTEIQTSDAAKPWPADVAVIDLAAEFKRGYVGVFAADTRETMYRTLEDNGRVLVMSARRGYTGILLCQRCGFSFKCPDCDLPMRIHQSATLNLVCHHCSRNQPYPNACPNCHSSQIKPTGPAGGQKIFEELQKMMTYGQLPRVPVLLMDADVTQNVTEEDEVMAEVRKPSPSILIATQKVFSYSYDTKFDSIIIPQLDALLVGSDFQSTERLWYQLEKLADFEPHQLVVQTFHQKDLVPRLARHEYKELYEGELMGRKAFWYPPYSRLVKLTYSHADWRKVLASARSVIEKLKMASIHIQAKDKINITETSPLFMRKDKGRYTYTILIKIAPDFSPRDLLRYVPTPWLIDIDPRTTT
jgi:primosomal protein N' (replication factor Y)